MTRFAASITPTAEAIGRLNDEVSDFLRVAEVDARAAHHVCLAIDELLTNVASHGGNPQAEAGVTIEVQPDRVIADIRDLGQPFDPRTPRRVETETTAEDRDIGGLGLHLVQQLTSSLDYRREGNQNWTGFCIMRERKD